MAKYTDPKELERDTLKKLANVVRAGALTCFQNIIVGSPVDTGRFRMNWQASINTPRLSIVGENAETLKDEHGKPVKNQFAQTDDVAGWTNGYTLNDTLYLTNNLPYAQRLADGWSKQRGSGWVDVEVANGHKAVRDALASAK
jgi:hypothetical protein